MSFLSPLMLLGALGIVIPLLVHLQGRRKAKVIHFAALDFLIGTDKRLAKRLLFRQFLQLLFRILICLGIALILARPVTSCHSEQTTVNSGPQAAVIILDNSVTSSYILDEESLLRRSQNSAIDIINQLGPEADIAFLTTTSINHTEFSRDQLGLKESIRSLRANNRTADTFSALERARQLLSSSNHQNKTIFLLVPATKNTIPESLTIPEKDIYLQIISPEGDSLLPNIGISNLQVHTDKNIGSRGITVTAQVANHSQKIQQIPISLYIDNKMVAKGEVEVQPGKKANKFFTATLQKGQRSTNIRVTISEDAMKADNQRFAVANARDQIPILIVNGSPSTVRHENEIYYIEAALRPGDRATSGTTLTIRSPDALSQLELDDFDVILLANAHALPKSQVTPLENWVKKGGGLFISLGNEVLPESYNRTMTPLLPQSLRTTLDLNRGQRISTGNSLRLSKLELDHPIFAVFDNDAPGLYNATFEKVMLLGPTTNTNNRKVLARYDNGAAALIESKIGVGTILLFTSSIDRDWNNLPIHPGFLPFIQQIVHFLASTAGGSNRTETLVGHSLSISILPNDAKIKVSGPNEIRMVLEGAKIKDRKTTRLENIDQAGIYKIQSENAEGEQQSRPNTAFAANIAPAVSDLSLTSTRFLTDRQVNTERETERTQQRQVELWHSITALLLFLLFMESCLGLFQSRTQKPVD